MMNFSPEFEWAGTDKDGNPLYLDKRFEKELKELAADSVNAQSKKPYSRLLEITPQGNHSYKLKLAPLIIDIKREYSTVINLQEVQK